MPTQAHLFVGIPINEPADLLKAATHFGVTPPANQNDLRDWDAAFTNSITIEGKPYSLEIYHDGESGVNWPTANARNKNTKTGQMGYSFTLLGAAITSRYSPTLADEGWDVGGRPDPFILDLARLTDILDAVQAGEWPHAEILMMDFHH